MQYINTTASALPTLTYAYSVDAETSLPTPNITCLDSSTLRIRNVVSNPGMLYEILAHVDAPDGTVACTPLSSSGPSNATLTVTGGSKAWMTWVGETDYSMETGNAASNYSFQGTDPHSNLVALLYSTAISTQSYTSILEEHITDYSSLVNKFSLSLGQTPNFQTPTDKLVSSYRTHFGNPYLEWLLFNYGRYLLVCSARSTLPANLQGIWANGLTNAWGSGKILCRFVNAIDDRSLHQIIVSALASDTSPMLNLLLDSNVNIQMNYWFAEMTNLDVSHSLFNYFEVKNFPLRY